MPDFPAVLACAAPVRRQLQFLRRGLLAALLLCASSMAAATETLAQALEDLDQHGYASPRTAIARLQSVTDRPGPGAPVEQQLRYHATLAQLAVHGKHKQELDAALGELKRLTDTGRCQPCGPYLLALRVGHAELNNRRDALKLLLDQLAALAPAADLRFEAERLGALSRGRALLDEEDAALNLGARAVEVAGRAGLPAAEARLMNSLVRVHFGRGDLANGLRVTKDCYALAERIGFRFLMAQARINQNYAYGTLKQDAEAHEALLDVLRITEGTPGTEALAQIAETNLSAHYIHQGDYVQAIRHTHAAEKLARQLGDEIGRPLQ